MVATCNITNTALLTLVELTSRCSPTFDDADTIEITATAMVVHARQTER